MGCALPLASWHKAESRLAPSSPSVASWSFPFRPQHNNPQPHPHHCPQDPSLLDQVSLNFARLVTSAEDQNEGREATSDLNDCAVRKDCVCTRMRREPIALLTKASSLRCLIVPSLPQKLRDSGIRKQRTEICFKNHLCFSQIGALSLRSLIDTCLKVPANTRKSWHEGIRRLLG